MNAVGLCLLLVGHAGQISLGHAGFYGLGAYTSAYLSTTVGLSVGLSMLAGVGLTVIVAILVGLPSLKLKGHYLAMATLGFGIILSILFTETVDITGGPSGFVGIPRFSLFGWELRKDVTLYRAVAVVLCLFVWLSFNLLHNTPSAGRFAPCISGAGGRGHGRGHRPLQTASRCAFRRIFRDSPECSTPIT